MSFATLRKVSIVVYRFTSKTFKNETGAEKYNFPKVQMKTRFKTMTFQKIFQVVKLASQGGLNSVDIASQKLQILGRFDDILFKFQLFYNF